MPLKPIDIVEAAADPKNMFSQAMVREIIKEVEIRAAGDHGDHVIRAMIPRIPMDANMRDRIRLAGKKIFISAAEILKYCNTKYKPDGKTKYLRIITRDNELVDQLESIPENEKVLHVIYKLSEEIKAKIVERNKQIEIENMKGEESFTLKRTVSFESIGRKSSRHNNRYKGLMKQNNELRRHSPVDNHKKPAYSKERRGSYTYERVGSYIASLGKNSKESTMVLPSIRPIDIQVNKDKNNLCDPADVFNTNFLTIFKHKKQLRPTKANSIMEMGSFNRTRDSRNMSHHFKDLSLELPIIARSLKSKEQSPKFLKTLNTEDTKNVSVMASKEYKAGNSISEKPQKKIGTGVVKLKAQPLKPQPIDPEIVKNKEEIDKVKNPVKLKILLEEAINALEKQTKKKNGGKGTL